MTSQESQEKEIRAMFRNAMLHRAKIEQEREAAQKAEFLATCRTPERQTPPMIRK